jgi:ATP-dependent DNA helicase RecG
MAIPINIEKLISGRIVESERIEYKKGWNPSAIYRTICAFANDYENIGGGYIIVGAEEEKGRAKRPVAGIPTEQLDAIQKEMIGLNHLINPYYTPKISIEIIDDAFILVIWVPGGVDRPYEVPEEIKAKDKRYHYYIRRYSSTMQANKEEREELISLAQQTPFDDRPNTQASIEDISPLLVKEYLTNVRSSLIEQIETKPLKEIYRAMDLLSGPDEHLYPKNIALMMFNYRPDTFFPYSRIEIVEFPNGLGDPTFFEKPAIVGPVYVQIRKALNQLEDIVLKERIHKLPDRAEAQRVWNYPYRALEEAIVNALYHRSYQVREPVEIRILPDAIEMINYGGPDRSSKLHEIKQGIIRNRRYRNRRIGDFLKELDMTEGRGTGIPIIRKEMANNGSPEPQFETNDSYSYFITTLPIHPAFLEDEAINEPLNGPLNPKQYEIENTDYENGTYIVRDSGPLNGPLNKKNGPLNGPLKNETTQIIEIIANQPGIARLDIIKKMGKGKTSVYRYLKILKDNDLVEYRGAKKTGGYFLSYKAKNSFYAAN